MVLFLGVMGNLPSLLALQSCQRNNTGVESVELQSAELLWGQDRLVALLGPICCLEAWLLHMIPNPHIASDRKYYLNPSIPVKKQKKY